MKISRLIEILQGIENKDELVEVAIGQYNKNYPIAYCDITDKGWNHLQTAHGCHRIEVTLPYSNEKFMYTAERKI